VYLDITHDHCLSEAQVQNDFDSKFKFQNSTLSVKKCTNIRVGNDNYINDNTMWT